MKKREEIRRIFGEQKEEKGKTISKRKNFYTFKKIMAVRDFKKLVRQETQTKLDLSDTEGAKKYRKEVLLNHSPAKDRIRVTCNNGIVTIRCEKAG